MRNALPAVPLADRLNNMSSKTKTTGKRDRHKPRRMVGLPTPMADAVEEWAKAKYSDLTTEVRNAVLKFMTENGIPLQPD